MILGIPFLVLFGGFTFVLLITTASLGIAMHVFKKDVFKYHRFFAFTTIAFALVHVTLATIFFLAGQLY